MAGVWYEMGMSIRKELERQGRGRSSEVVSNHRGETIQRLCDVIAEFNHTMDIKFSF